MNDFRNRIRPDWPAILRSILSRARSIGPKGVLAFDLDSTLFDNRPRQARILREYGQAKRIDALTQCKPEDWSSGWDMKGAMARCGLHAEQIEALYADARVFWQERFFTSEYCIDDVAISGAPKFIRDARATGALLAYVTGRHEGMREGTVSAMAKCGLALPGGNVSLLMKPTFEMGDDEFKRETHEYLGRLGMLVAAFDNEPTHVNDYQRKFPKAAVVHLATDHSGRPVDLLEEIVTVPHFDVGSII